MDNTRNRKIVDEIEILPESMNNNENIRVKPKLSLQDKQSICVLTFLYILQGIPLGLAGSVPLMLQSKKVSYSTQATFSFVFWPFSLKILWAPIVDSMYSSKFGRRKTWLVPCQYLIGLTMFYVSFNAQKWLSGDIEILKLTSAFFLLNFLAATQDIAVDGWALTMLSKTSVGWASTCNSVGQTVGYFIAFIIFLALESSEFCNNWLRSIPASTGLVTFDGFLYFWGIIFIITTTFVMLFKREKPAGDSVLSHGDNKENGEEITMGLLKTYQTLWKIVKLKPILMYVAILMSIKVGFSATDSITGLKLIEKGVSKEKMAFIGSMIVPVQILLAIVVSKYTTGAAPLNVFIKAAIPRLLYGPLFCLLIYITPWFQQIDGSYSYSYYAMLTVFYSSHQIFVYPMFVSLMAFYARISDPNVGGTYMTLLNTVTNLASNIPSTIMLYLVDHLTTKTCKGGPHSGISCSSKENFGFCTNSNPKGICEITFDGYYVEVLVCTIIGFIAVFAKRHYLYHIQSLPMKAWLISK
uniref:Slc33a-1 n=2 Tax=Schmidtea mediterranea TaxID=79327 RepID=A0A0H3YJB9_SCHMD|nr:slc33a-1 [Schmidtea mediterranea]